MKTIKLILLITAALIALPILLPLILLFIGLGGIYLSFRETGNYNG